MIALLLAPLLALLQAFEARAECPEIMVDEMIDYAASGVGSNYVWGGGAWNASNRSWSGADCSGFVGKVFQVPAYTATTTYSHPYSTYNFYNESTHWSRVSRSSPELGDGWVRHSSGAGHTGIYDYGDSWGSPVTYEAMGTAWGIVHGSRTLSSEYVFIRRHRLTGSDADGDGYGGDDCDDANAAVNPGADELCDRVDNDCDGSTDESSAIDADTWYRDADSDGYGDPDATSQACTRPSGYVADDGDCDDGDARVNPGAMELCDAIDNNCDASVDEGYDLDADRYRTCDGDCADDDAARNPGAVEIVNAVDDDCDWRVDEGSLGYDDDGDGWSETAGDCDDADAFTFPRAPEAADGEDDDCDGAVDEGTAGVDDDADGWSEQAGDCDDTNAEIHPGADEVADARDGDCDGRADEGTLAYDDDGDSFVEDAGAPNGGDCDDHDRLAFPGAPEIADGVDNDCDLVVDDGTVAFDDDGDGWTELQGDCDDRAVGTHPFAQEADDGFDQDCDWIADNGTPRFDDDHDGWSEDDGDCDDLSPGTFPGGKERIDGADNDCDGRIDDATAVFDDDGDGWSEDDLDCDDTRPESFPGAAEVVDDLDNDCDGRADDETDVSDDDLDGWTEEQGDCDDGDAHTFPGATEHTDGRDGDCDGAAEAPEGWFSSVCGTPGLGPSAVGGWIGIVLAAALARRSRREA